MWSQEPYTVHWILLDAVPPRRPPSRARLAALAAVAQLLPDRVSEGGAVAIDAFVAWARRRVVVKGDRAAQAPAWQPHRSRVAMKAEVGGTEDRKAAEGRQES